VSGYRWTLILALLALLAGVAAASGAEFPEIPHKVQPSEQFLIGGQPDEAALRQAAEAGIEVVVNLRGPTESTDFDQSQLVAELGMTYVRLPISGANDLTPENVRAFGGFLEAIGDRPALLHCASGNRVGALFALHAGLNEGMDTEAALELGREHGMTGLEETVRKQLEDGARP
jgi:uncharacterized protein (TIGR01244 family)